MDRQDKKIPLTSAEIGILWSAYMNDSMAICVLKHFVNNVEDGEIKEDVAYALQLSEKYVQLLTDTFNKDKMPVPHGFTEKDVDLTVPRLFSDAFYGYYIYHLSILGLDAYAIAISVSARHDIRDYFQGAIQSSIELQNRVVNTLESKGLYIRPPYMQIPQNTDFVDHKGLLTGFLGERRTLNAMEIMHLHRNIQTNHLGRSLMMGFSQVAKSEELRKYLVRGRELATKHFEAFRTALLESDIATPMTWDFLVTDSTTSPFSDRLILFHTAMLISQGIANYGTAVSQSPRHDLSHLYARLSGEVGNYSNEGAKLLIKNHWLERVPQSVEREELIKK